MDITSARILKLKKSQILLLGTSAASVLLVPDFEWRKLVLLGIAVWAFCRAYYFCFYLLADLLQDSSCTTWLIHVIFST